MEASLCTISQWMKSSGLKINESKTELCLFSRNDVAAMVMSVNGVDVSTKSEINVLGVLFDSKLQWGPQVQKTLTKANKALNAIRMIRNYFDQEDLLRLITSNFYSVLYYNSEVWHLPTLHQSLQNQLLSASAKAIKLCTKTTDMWMISYKELHEMAGRATPNQLMDYKMALQAYKTINHEITTADWVSINYNNTITSRQTKFSINKMNRYKVGMNVFSNRLWYINGKIDLEWLNLSFNSFKIKCKKKFL